MNFYFETSPISVLYEPADRSPAIHVFLTVMALVGGVLAIMSAAHAVSMKVLGRFGIED